MNTGQRPSRIHLSLSRVATRLEREGLLESRSADDAVLTGISDDSRAVRAGDLYCAWRGTTVDGHEFLPQAVEAGAVAALVERPVAGGSVPQLEVRDGRRAAAVASAEVFGDPAGELVLVGITGTNGKTTTVSILRHLLAGQWATVSLGTLGALWADGRPALEVGNLTTPGPVELARTLRRLKDMGVEAVVMEASSHALAQGRVHALRFDTTVFTNVSRDHLDYHGTEEEYIRAKELLLELLAEDGTAVINADEAAWGRLLRRAERRLLFSVENRPEADLRADGIRISATGATFLLTASGREVEVGLPLTGAFNVENALAAAGAALSVGCSLDEVVERLRDTPQVPGRLERIAEEPCTVIRDYAHTPAALERVLSTIGALAEGRLIVVFGAGGERDSGKRPLMGRVAEMHADVVVVTSDNPRTEDPDAIIDQIVEGMERGATIREPDRRTAIARALAIAGPDDVVLLAGKGHETYQILGTERIDFDERRIVAELTAPGIDPATADQAPASDDEGGL